MVFSSIFVFLSKLSSDMDELMQLKFFFQSECTVQYFLTFVRKTAANIATVAGKT